MDNDNQILPPPSFIALYSDARGRLRKVQLEDLLVIALPGSPRAAAQCMNILTPVLGHALAMMDGGTHA